MAHIYINDLEPNDRNKIIELKVYRKWVNRNPQSPIPTGYCCMLLDTQGDVVQANMDFKDMNYFDQLLEQHSAYKISNFYCEHTSKWQQTLPNPTSLRFGKFTKFENIPCDGFPVHHFRFLSYNQLFERFVRDPILTDYIGSIQRVGEVIRTGNPNRNQIIRRCIDIENLNGNVVAFTLWDDSATNFDVQAFQSLPKPVMVAVSSCRVSKYGGVAIFSRYYRKPTTIRHSSNSLLFKSQYTRS